MANYFYGPYNFLKQPAAVQRKQSSIPCPRCASPRVHQVITPLVNPETLRPILAPERMIFLSLIIGLIACLLIILGSWWAIGGALLQLAVFYLIMTKLPLAFRAREQQVLLLCCQQCRHRWLKENPL